MNKAVNIVICGLGGQGVVMISRILAEVALSEGHKAIAADVLPISQRLASTMSFVRIGEDIFSEVVPEGEADLLIGFEPLQTLKYGVAFASENGSVIMNERPIDLRPNLKVRYPAGSEILAYFREMGVRRLIHFDALEIAIKITGSMLALNMVMLGAAFATALIPAQRKTFETIIRKVTPHSEVKGNIEAFLAGIAAVAKA